MRVALAFLFCCFVSQLQAADNFEYDSHSLFTNAHLDYKLGAQPATRSYVPIPSNADQDTDENDDGFAQTNQDSTVTGAGGALDYDITAVARYNENTSDWRTSTGTIHYAACVTTHQDWEAEIRSYAKATSRLFILNTAGENVDWSGKVVIGSVDGVDAGEGIDDGYRIRVLCGGTEIIADLDNGEWVFSGSRDYWENGTLKTEDVDDWDPQPVGSLSVDVSCGGTCIKASTVWMRTEQEKHSFSYGHSECSGLNQQDDHDFDFVAQAIVYDDN